MEEHYLFMQRSWQDRRKLGTLLFWGGIFLFLFLPPLYATIFALRMGLPTWEYASRHTVAIFALHLLGLIAAVTLITQVRGYSVPVWLPLTPALLLFVLLWWVL